MTSSILPAPESRRLGRELASLRAEVDTLRASQRATQLGNSTLYGAIYIADPDGNVKGIVGEQADGSTGVVVTDGPAPPAPSGLSLTPDMAGVNLGWTGTFVAAKPLNFSHCNAYLSDAGPDFIHGPSNHVGTLSDAGTIPVTPLPSGTQWWARLVAVNTSVPPGESPPSVTVGPVSPDQVVAQDVLDGIVTEVKLANDAVTAAKIAAGAVGTGEIAGQAVTLSQLANGSVDATKLTTGAVTQPAIAANAVTANALAANSVIAGKLAADSVQTVNLVAGSVQTEKIAAGAVLADKIAANAVTAEKINALAVTADKVSANAINAGHIQAGAVTASKLAATLVLGTTIIAGTSTAGARVQLDAGGIEAYRSNGMKVLDFDTVTGDMTIAGRYRSQDGGSRVEINPGGNAPDEIRLYQDNVYALIRAELGAGNTGAIVMRASPSGRGQVGAYGAEAYTGWFTGSETFARSAAAAQADRLNLFGGDVFISTRQAYGSGIVEFTEDGRLDSLLQYVRRSDGAGPCFIHPGESGLIFGSDAIGVLDGTTGNNGPIVATDYLPPSSREVKRNEQPATLAMGTARTVLRNLAVKKFNYIFERIASDPEPAPQWVTRKRAVLDADGQPVQDPATGETLMEEYRVQLPLPPVRKPHIGLIAEEVQQWLPEAVRESPLAPGGLTLSFNDLVGWLILVNREQDTALETLAARVTKIEQSLIRLNLGGLF